MALTLLAVETEFSDGPIRDAGLFNNSTVYRFEAQMDSRVAQNVFFRFAGGPPVSPAVQPRHQRKYLRIRDGLMVRTIAASPGFEKEYVADV